MKKRWVLKRYILLSALLWLGTWGLAAETESDSAEDLYDLSLEQLMEVEIDTVYTASRHEQKISEAPSSITTISDEEIRLYGYRSLIDILESLPGFYKTSDRNYGYIGVRGFGRPGDYSSRVLVMIDGHRVNGNIADSVALAHDFMLDVDLIKKIEVVRGPGSALYGSNALFAVINIITKDGADYGGTEIAGRMASHDTEQARLTYGTTFNDDFSALFSGTYYDSDGDRLYYDEFAGSTDNDDENAKSFLVKLGYKDFTFVATHTQREKGVPTAPWGTVFGDRRTRTDDDQTLLGLAYEKQLTDDFGMLWRVSYFHYNYYGDWVYDDGGIYINEDEWNGRRWSSELQFSHEIDENHHLIFGAKAQYNVAQDQTNYDEFDTYLDDQRHSKNWGIFIQDEIQLTDNLILNAGIRQDYYDSTGFSVNPRAAIIYTPVEDTTLKFLYATAFRAPSAYELFYHDSGWTTKSNPDLDPEEIESFEFVLEQKINDIYRFTFSGYYNTIENLVDQRLDPDDGLLQFQNLSEATAKGIEATLQAHWKNGARAKASYSYVQTRDKTTGTSLANSPKHMVNFNVIYPVLEEKLFVGVDTKWTSKRKTLSGNHTGNAFVTNLTLTYQDLIKDMDIQAGIYNLFDETYEHPGFGEHTQDTLEQDGRMVGVKMTYRF